MADEILVLRGEGNVDVQVGGAGNNWIYLSACASMSGPTVPRGETEIRWCQDPRKANGFRISSQFRTAPDQISGEMMTKLGKIDYLEDLNCPFSVRARYAKCGEREDPSNYDPMMLAYCPVQISEHSYEDLVVTDPANQDEILVTAPWLANYEYRIKKMTPGRIGGSATNIGDQPINDIEYCDEEACAGYCGDRTDGCALIYAVTDADTSPYAAPNFIKGVKNLTTDAITWTVSPILGINSNVEAIECAGSRIVVTSNGDSVVAYNTMDGDQDEWNIVSLANAPSPFQAALFARTSRELWLAAANGYVYKSVNGGATWSAVHEGTLTTERINAVWAHDKDLVYAVGDNGVMIKSIDGGETWSDITETSTFSSNVLVVAVPPDRAREVYVGANNGKVYRSKDEGATFTALSFDGDGVGSVDDIAFCGPCGSDVMFILHNDAGPRGRILRDLSGGAGGADIEVVSGYTSVIAAGIELNALTCCDQNKVLAGGENNAGFPVIIQGT